MPFDPERLLALPPRELRQSFDRRDTILYALGAGAGIDAADDDDLIYVYEDGLKAVPTMPVVIASPGFWQKQPEFGIDWQKVLHAEQFVTMHCPFPVAGEIVSLFRISEIYDKGADKGALLYVERLVSDAATGEPLATIRQSSFLRGDGGFGGKAVNPRRPVTIPERAPDHQVTLRTRPEQAMIYRLSGDYNPLHIDPAIARSGGFGRPILHGLCTYAIAGRAAVKALCAGDPDRLRQLDVRFSSPVFPGETIEVQLWATGTGKAALRARVVERNVVVLTNGHVEFD